MTALAVINLACWAVVAVTGIANERDRRRLLRENRALRDLNHHLINDRRPKPHHPPTDNFTFNLNLSLDDPPDLYLPLNRFFRIEPEEPTGG